MLIEFPAPTGTVNGNDPAQYVEAWRHMHGIFRKVGTPNVSWVWSPLVDDVPSDNRFEPYYPGNTFVDVLALDGYNWGTRESGYGDWRSFRQVFSNAYERIARLGRKPIWIAEVGSAVEGGDKAAWIDEMFKELSEGFAPRITTIVWFHIDKERDWRMTSPEGVAAAFRDWLPRFRR